MEEYRKYYVSPKRPRNSSNCELSEGSHVSPSPLHELFVSAQAAQSKVKLTIFTFIEKLL
jgi:hypothetical protein